MEKKKEEACLVIFLALFFCLPFVCAQGSNEAQGGNISVLAISGTSQTKNWQGIAGDIFFIPPNSTLYNATGSHLNISDLQFDVGCIPISISGFIIFSNSSSPPAVFLPGNLSLLDSFVGAGSDSGSNTFTYLSSFTISGITINNVPTTNTYVNSHPQNSTFREGYFNDASNNLVFVTEIYEDLSGYNGSKFDFQAILPSPDYSTTTYYISGSLDVVCPSNVTPTPGGGGWSPRIEVVRYVCSNWTPCINGLQRRNCTPVDIFGNIIRTPYYLKRIPLPPLTKVCPYPEYPLPLDDSGLIKRLREFNISVEADNLTLFIREPENVFVDVYNHDYFSIENLEFSIDVPLILTKPKPLHKEPVFYNTFFGFFARKVSIIEMPWQIVLPKTQRIDPKSFLSENIILVPPVMKPKTVDANINVLSADVPLTSKKILLDVDVRPFKAVAERKSNHVAFYLIFDNREKTEKEIEVEVDWNKGRKTLFTELYSLSLDEDDVLIFSYDYGIDFDFDEVKIRYDDEIYFAEVI